MDLRIIARRVLHFARLSPKLPALIEGQNTLSYGELGQCIAHAARELGEHGLVQSDRVILPASNTRAFILSYLAVHLCGAIAVPVDAGTPKTRVDDIQTRTSARFFLSGPDQHALMEHAVSHIGNAPEPASTNLPPPSAPADIMFTSGTTGIPKGVVLSHQNIARAADHINAFVGTRQDDIELLALPLAHAFGLGSLRAVLSVGACAVLVEGFAFPGQIFAGLQQHRATGFRCVPAGLATLFRLSKDKLGEFANTLRYMEIGSAPMPIDDKMRLMELLPHTRICMHYGLTEAARSMFIEFHQDADHLTSIGRPAYGVEAQIAGERGDLLPPGTPGEIWIRGPHVMQGYWGDPERSEQTLEGEWLHTGDLGYSDPQGYLYLQGRRNDMINIGGKKVSPLEVEQALLTHPQVLDCACVGIEEPGNLLGETVAALVRLSTDQNIDERALRNHLRHMIETYKIPTRWLFTGDIPRTSNGKIQRNLLRDQLQNGVPN